jgi:MoaA/NifB/PqqE/SkfB family radical SAM enzyme
MEKLPLTISLEKATGIIVRSLTPSRPYHVQWLLTRKCNYRCRGCNVWREQDGKELSTQEVKIGLDILRELGTVEVVFSGGNPLLRDDIGEIIEYASRYFITTVYDNGSMAVEKMDDLHKADFVAISIDSLDPKKNDFLRGVKGSWSKAMQAITELHEKGISVSASPTISQANLYEILDLTNYFLDKDIPMWYCLYSYDLPDQNQLFKIGRKSDEFSIRDRKALINLFNSLIQLKKKNTKILMTTRILEAIRNFYLTGKRVWKCRALQNFLVVDHLGRVGGCHLHNSATTIFNLPKVWNGPEFDALRKKYSKCVQCNYMCYIFYSVHGGVRGNIQIAKEQWKNAKLIMKKN